MDHVLRGFLEAQWEECRRLTQRSSVLTLVPMGGPPPDRYRVRFGCRTLVRTPGGDVVEREGFEVGIRFPPDYLRRTPSPIEVVSFLGPADAFLPNVGPGPGGRTYICIGEISLQTPLIDLLLRCFEIASGQHLTMDEHDALNHDACRWARANGHRFPIDGRTMLGREMPGVRASASAAADGEGAS